MTASPTCHVCRLPVAPEQAHDDHHDGCGRHLCDCDLTAHPACCQFCRGLNEGEAA